MNSSPFLLNNHQAYKLWREMKLRNTPDYRQTDPDTLIFEVSEPGSLSNNDTRHLLTACHNNSMALYRFKNLEHNNKGYVHRFAQQLGLQRLDNNLCADSDKLTSITKTDHPGQHEYIPYSNKRLSWHTDGYYNKPENQINGMLLHCASPAKEGGESLLLDHEIAYLLLRDENPAYIEALMQKDAMTIPANILEGEIVRAEQSGPVFSVNTMGKLHMRYSARQRNIEWKQNAHTLEAVAFLQNLWKEASTGNSPYILRYTLQAGEGLICNNILHCRTAFVDFDDPSKKRLLYRGRYYDHVTSDHITSDVE